MFHVPLPEMKKIIRDFHSEMDKGLRRQNSSLKMIPAYVDRPTGREKGKFIALDLGGTNFRILELELKGRGRFGRVKSEKFVLGKKYIRGEGGRLFDFIAGCLKSFLKRNKMDGAAEVKAGFTFSFPVEQTAAASGRLHGWTKGFELKGTVGKDVAGLLNDAFLRSGLNNVKVAALVNDTVATLAAGSYCDKTCDVGLILGTGTNACYAERLANIRKWRGPSLRSGEMIVNIEWGNFDRLKATPYDRLLDRECNNPREQMLEKMISGMYLGRIAYFALKGLGGCFGGIREFKTEYVSAIEADKSRNLGKTGRFLKKAGVPGSTLQDRQACKKVCEIVSLRASRIVSSCIAAVITKIDPGMKRSHTVAVDGSLYEKHPGFAGNIQKALREISNRKEARIKISLTKDGSGIGAAVVAAVTSAQ
ncbi:MAG: hypothetical protein PHT32_03940 [Candidatus Omnitrophica bacterium]|nr:hypothetical protein [Candidatus Omnitrophota bacterium]